MKHNVDHRKLGRKSQHRLSMLANMASSLILKDRIETTLPKAKELRRIADRIVTLSKTGTLHARRNALSILRDQTAVHHAFETFAKRFDGRNGGYTRIYRLGHRHGDSAPMAIIEYLRETATILPSIGEEKTKKKSTKTAKEPKKKSAEKSEKKSKKKFLGS